MTAAIVAAAAAATRGVAANQSNGMCIELCMLFGLTAHVLLFSLSTSFLFIPSISMAFGHFSIDLCRTYITYRAVCM